MSAHSSQVARYFFLDLFGSAIRFPFWWYGTGLKRVALSFYRSLQYRAQGYGLSVWIRNFFVPMYGQHDITGRLISVLMRFVVLVARVFALIVEAAVYALGIIVYVLLPVGSVLLAVVNIAAGVA